MRAWLRRPTRTRELGLVLAVVGLYESGRFVSVTDPLANARALIAFEQTLGLGWEGPIQAWFLASAPRPLLHAAGWYYLPMHIIPFLGLYLYELARLDGAFWHMRRAALAVVPTAMIFTSILPVAPPRLVPESGIQLDLVARVDAPGFGTPLVEALADPVAAFPSEHVVWAMVVAWVLVRFHHRLLWPLAAFHVAATCFVVVASGHHYVIDVLAGLLIGAVGIWLGEHVAFPGEPRVGGDER